MALHYTENPDFLYRHRKRVRKSNGAVNYYTYTASRTIAGTNSVHPTPSSRSKPSDPESNPTALGPYYDYSADAGVYSWETEKSVRFYWYYDTHYETEMPFEPISAISYPEGGTEHLLACRDQKAVVSSMLAELDKTADGFTTLARKLGKIVNRVRRFKRDALRGKFRNFKSDLREKDPLTWTDLAETRLAIEYGVKPVVGDLYMVKSHLDALNRAKRRRVQTSVKHEVSLTASGVPWTGKARRKYISYFEVQSNNINYDIGHPAEWAWELTPFSFVVDWFIPVGDYLQASYATRGLSHISTTFTDTLQLAVDNYPPPRGFWVERPRGSIRRYQRFVSGDFPLPDSIPLAPSLSANRAANAAALVVAVGSGTRKRY